MRRFVKGFETYHGTTWTEESTPDWEQRRYEIAKEVLAASVIANISDFGHVPNDAYYKSCATYAISCADALIEELKK